MKEIKEILIETPRIRLRAWREKDIPALFRLARDRDVADRAGFRPHKTEEESREIFRTILSRPGSFAVVRREDDVLLGSAACTYVKMTNPDMKEGDVEIGYWIGAKYWRQGYATEVAQALVGYAFAGLGAEQVWCRTTPDNYASRRVQEKCGFVFHHHVFGEPVKQLGTCRDMVYTRMLRPEGL